MRRILMRSAAHCVRIFPTSILRQARERSRRASVGALLLVLLAACAAPPAMAPAPASTQVAAECPSQDFTRFLEQYLAVYDAHRRRFTLDAVEYAVPYYLVAEPAPDSPDMHVSLLRGEERFQHVPYRYRQETGDFHRLQDTTADARSSAPWPVDIRAQPDGSREVVFGLEYEIDIYHFARRDECWYLTRITNPRD